jgi:Sigma-70 region 2
MNEREYLAERFEEHRTHLRAVAYRMLGSLSEVDDAVQEAWLRLSRADSAEIDNLGGWLTTVVARVCLDMLRSRTSRREEPFAPDAHEPVATGTQGNNFFVAMPVGNASHAGDVERDSSWLSPVSGRTMLRSAAFASSVVASIPIVLPFTSLASASRILKIGASRVSIRRQDVSCLLARMVRLV